MFRNGTTDGWLRKEQERTQWYVSFRVSCRGASWRRRLAEASEGDGARMAVQTSSQAPHR